MSFYFHLLMWRFSENFQDLGERETYKKEESMHIRGDVSDSGDQRAMGDRQRERGRGEGEIMTAAREGATLVGKEVRKREDKAMNLFNVPTHHTELTFLV